MSCPSSAGVEFLDRNSSPLELSRHTGAGLGNLLLLALNGNTLPNLDRNSSVADDLQDGLT